MATQRARASASVSAARVALLKQVALSSLASSPPTALFFAERLVALDPTKEESVYLIALSLAQNERTDEAIWALRQPVSFVPSLNPAPGSLEEQQAPPPPPTTHRRTHAPKVLSRPALECSVRCARLYASQCHRAGRDKEGRDALAKVLTPGTPLVSPTTSPTTSTGITDGSFDTSPASAFKDTDSWVYDLELARLARRAGEPDRAVVAFRKVLAANAWCWEALEQLCQLGHPPDPDLLFPPRVRQQALPPSQPISPVISTHQPLSRPLPPPLGPSQTSAVNSAVPFVVAKPRSGGNGGATDNGLGLYTPGDAMSAANLGLVAQQGKGFQDGKRLFTLGAGGIWRKPGLPPPRHGQADVVEMSIDDSNSFEHSFYPSQPTNPAPAPLSYVPQAALLNAHASSSSSNLFTPPPTTSLPSAAPGVKRARGDKAFPTSASIAAATASAASSSTLPIDHDDLKPGRRVVRGVPGTDKRGDKATRDPSGGGAPTRRSSRLSRETGSSNGTSVAAPSSSGMSISRSQTSRASSSTTAAPTTTTTAGGKRRKNVAGARYDGPKSIEALQSLPVEQQRSWRCLIGVGRAYFDMLNYDKAEKAFAQARVAAPHLLDSMELYSTVLWHMRLATPLSFLAQDLMAIAPGATQSWIAAGNVFSHLKDHPAALKCFKRAAQLDSQCVYAYTLSGHECVELDEWERALGFFREAVRLDSRHYNAWFGLGNVYMQTGKYRLAEYYFRKAIEINPTNATLICCVGTVLEKVGRRKEALDLYERACVLAPESPIPRFRRVKMLISLRQYQTAEADLLQLKDKTPNEFNVFFLLGKLYKSLHRQPEMLKYFALAQDLEPRTAALIRETIARDVDGEMDVDEASDILS
ncbi:hypothetical protein RQP46_005314 [Phenoliferia psychrophenolica]